MKIKLTDCPAEIQQDVSEILDFYHVDKTAIWAVTEVTIPYKRNLELVTDYYVIIRVNSGFSVTHYQTKPGAALYSEDLVVTDRELRTLMDCCFEHLEMLKSTDLYSFFVVL